MTFFWTPFSCNFSAYSPYHHPPNILYIKRSPAPFLGFFYNFNFSIFSSFIDLIHLILYFIISVLAFYLTVSLTIFMGIIQRPIRSMQVFSIAEADYYLCVGALLFDRTYGTSRQRTLTGLKNRPLSILPFFPEWFVRFDQRLSFPPNFLYIKRTPPPVAQVIWGGRQQETLSWLMDDLKGTRP